MYIENCGSRLPPLVVEEKTDMRCYSAKRKTIPEDSDADLGPVKVRTLDDNRKICYETNCVYYSGDPNTTRPPDNI